MAPDAVRWIIPEEVREIDFRRAKRLMWNRAVRIFALGMAFLAVMGAVLYRIEPAMPVGRVIAGFGGLFFLFLLEPLTLRRSKVVAERAFDGEGLHVPGAQVPRIRWRQFRGYDLDPWPDDARYRRLRLLKTAMGSPPLDLVLPSEPATCEQIVERVASHLPRAYPGVRDRGPVEGWPLAIGLVCALGYGVVAGWLAGPYVAHVTEYARQLPHVVATFAPALAFFLVGPGWPCALLARQFRPLRLTRHYVFSALILNMVGNMVLLTAAGLRLLGQ